MGKFLSSSKQHPIEDSSSPRDGLVWTLKVVATVMTMKGIASNTEVEKNDGGGDANKDEEEIDYESHDEGLQEKREESWV